MNWGEIIGNNFIASLAGSGFGAYAAFFLSSRKQHQDNTQKDWNDVATVFFLLSARLSAAENFARKYLTEDRTAIQQEQASNLCYQQFPTERTEVSKLTSLISGRTAQLIQDLSVCEQKYFDMVEAHSERHRSIWLQMGKDLSDPRDRIYDHVRRITNGMLLSQQNTLLVDSTNWAIRSLNEEIQNLSAAIKDRFPTMPKLSCKLRS